LFIIFLILRSQAAIGWTYQSYALKQSNRIW
jgi:hypothetical protein